ncbi:MAG: hypothetical protein CVV05_01590 [Gammaproteobacteria bacterium HGW-Gammaproteobacteria-1]|nr:MAG: hypothetical protein CVV05_01590 [Gammaproteobacteria bacterium HGW-Gammaproteobacteria-1]
MAIYTRTIQSDGSIDFYGMRFSFLAGPQFAGLRCSLQYVNEGQFLGFDVEVDGRFVGFATRRG